jgi:MscS family membrane protein
MSDTERVIIAEEVPPDQPIDYANIPVLLLRSTLAIAVLISLTLLRSTIATAVVSLIRLFTSKMNEDVRQKLERKIAAPISYACILGGVYFAGIIFDLPDFLQEAFDHVVQSLVNVFVFWLAYSAVTPIAILIQKSSSNTFGDEIRKVLTDLIKAVVTVLGFLSVLQAWGINVSAFLAGLGLVGMAVALAAQDTFRNLFGSVVLFADGALKEGEWIQTPEVEGVVERVGLRTTAIRNFDTSLVLIPNANLAGSIINKRGMRRINWTLPIAGGTAKAMQAIVQRFEQSLTENPKVDKTMTMIVALDKFGENCVELFVYFFLVAGLSWPDFMAVKQDIILAFKAIVAEENASFGVPTRLVLLNKA